MAREKKITVKPFLNKTLKSVGFTTDEDMYYPIYFLVTYNRRVTKFPAPVHWHYPEDNENNLDEDERVKDMVHKIEQVIRYEIKQTYDYSITGLGKRLKVYYDRLFSLVDYFNAANLRAKGFEVKSLPGGTPFQERLAAGIMTVAADDRASHELYYLARFLEAKFPTHDAIFWVLDGARESIISDIERYYHAGHSVDYEYANRLTQGVRMNFGVNDLEKTLDQIVLFSSFKNLTLFSDLQLVMKSSKDGKRLKVTSSN